MRARVHRLAETLLIEACNAAARESRWTPKRVDSYACRTIRGSSARSLHSWGLAWDFFATDPGVTPPGGVWKPANTVTPDFAACFERLGFTWGRNFSRQDWPHLELAGPPPSRVQTQTTNVPGEVIVAPQYDPPFGPICAELEDPDTPHGVWLASPTGGLYAVGGARVTWQFSGPPEGKSYFAGRRVARLELGPNRTPVVVTTSNERYGKDGF
jgi:hypothetical protein